MPLSFHRKPRNDSAGEPGQGAGLPGLLPRRFYPKPGAGEAIRVGCSPPPTRPAKPVFPPPPGACPRCRRTHRECSPACRSYGWVSPSRRKQNWLGPAGAALCPLIRHFRQGGLRCGYSSPTHS